MGVRWCLTVVLMYFSDDKWCWVSFIYLLVISTSWEMSMQVSCPLKKNFYFHLKGRKKKREKQEKISSIHWLICFPNVHNRYGRPSPKSGAWNSIQFPQRWRGLSTRATRHCFPECARRNRNQKQSSCNWTRHSLWVWWLNLMSHNIHPGPISTWGAYGQFLYFLTGCYWNVWVIYTF